MIGPRRLLEGDGSPLARQLLLSARWEKPRDGGVERALTAVGLSIAVASTAAGASAAASTTAATMSATTSAGTTLVGATAAGAKTAGVAATAVASAAKGVLAAVAMKWAVVGAVGGALVAGAAEGPKVVEHWSSATAVHAASPPSDVWVDGRSRASSPRLSGAVPAAPTNGAEPTRGDWGAPLGASDRPDRTAPMGSVQPIPITNRAQGAIVNPSPSPLSLNNRQALSPQPEPPGTMPMGPSLDNVPKVALAGGVRPTEGTPAVATDRNSADSTVATLHAGAASDADRLTSEVVLIDRIRAELGARHVNEALAMLARYSRDFPAGRLAPEAELLRIRALLEKGDRQTATATARRLLRANPDGPYARQIRALLAATSESSSIP